MLIVGAGPAGLAAARAAAVDGLKVVLVDENAEAGGTLLSEPQAKIDGKPAWTWLADDLKVLKDQGVKVMTRTTGIAYYHPDLSHPLWRQGRQSSGGGDEP